MKRLVLRPKASSNNDTPALDISTNEGVRDQYNNSLNDNSVIVIDYPRHSLTPPRDIILTDENSKKETQRISPSNIQKRIGLDSPRGGILKNSHNMSNSGEFFTTYILIQLYKRKYLKKNLRKHNCN